MNPRFRKFIGANLLILFLGVYTLLIMRLSVELPLGNTLIELAYYAFFGVIWVFPAKLIINWMEKRNTPEDED